MLCSCIVTELKSTFDSLACEFTAKTGEGGIVSRCGCNIFTIGNRFTSRRSGFQALSSCRSFFFLPLKSVHAEYMACSRLWTGSRPDGVRSCSAALANKRYR